MGSLGTLADDASVLIFEALLSLFLFPLFLSFQLGRLFAEYNPDEPVQTIITIKIVAGEFKKHFTRYWKYLLANILPNC